MRIFDMDSPFQRFLDRMTDLLVLNLFTMLLCLPVITAGASLTAMHYVLLRMVRGQDGYVIPSFMRSFRRNWKQASIIWAFMLLYGFLTAGNLISAVTGKTMLPVWIMAVLAASLLLEYLLSLYVFPLLSRYDNPIRRTLFNALILTFTRLPLTVGMAIITAVPALLLLTVRPLLPVVVLFGLSVPGYVCAMLYRRLFDIIEGRGEGSDTQD